ncbi:hypothetical protein, partial [Paracoccus marcusii]
MSDTSDIRLSRRGLLAKLGLAAGAAGVIYAAPTLVGFGAAHASGASGRSGRGGSGRGNSGRGGSGRGGSGRGG